MADSVLAIGHDFRITSFNRAAEKITKFHVKRLEVVITAYLHICGTLGIPEDRDLNNPGMPKQYSGNKTQAPKALGIDRRTLWRKFKRYENL